MPSLLESIFREKGDKVTFQDVIERGLRVARGEKFEPVDQPEEIETEGAFDAFLKGITRAAEKGVEGFKEKIGFDPKVTQAAPQRKVDPKFRQIEDPTILENLAETAGEFLPQLAGGVGISSPLPGALAGAAEDFLAGGSQEDIALGAIGGGVGGMLGRFFRNLPDNEVGKLLSNAPESGDVVDVVTREAVGIEKALSPEKIDVSNIMDDSTLRAIREDMGVVPEARPEPFGALRLPGQEPKRYPKGSGGAHLGTNLTAAENRIKKALGPGMKSREKNAFIQAMTVEQRHSLAKQLDRSSAKTGLSLTEALCKSLARAGK